MDFPQHVKREIGGERRRDSVPDLPEPFVEGARKRVVGGETLEQSGLPYREATILLRVEKTTAGRVTRVVGDCD